MIVSADLSSSQFEAAIFVLNYTLANTDRKNDTTIIASPIYASMYNMLFMAPIHGLLIYQVLSNFN